MTEPVKQACPTPWCRETEQLSFIVSHWSGNACVECLKCHVRGPWETSTAEAVVAWNQRETAVDQNQRVNEIKRLLERLFYTPAGEPHLTIEEVAVSITAIFAGTP